MILSENEVAAEQRETRCPCEGNREGNETGERRRNNSSVGRSVLGCERPRAGFWAWAGGDGQTEEIPDKAGRMAGDAQWRENGGQQTARSHPTC